MSDKDTLTRASVVAWLRREAKRISNIRPHETWTMTSSDQRFAMAKFCNNLAAWLEAGERIEEADHA